MSAQEFLPLSSAPPEVPAAPKTRALDPPAGSGTAPAGRSIGARRERLEAMNRQEYWRKRYKEIRSGWTPSPTIYRQLIDQRVHEDTRILDIGCGHSDLLGDVFGRTRRTYGIDTDAAALARNEIIGGRVVGDAEHLPFRGSSLDLVVLAWVLEHIEHPGRVFREIHRVLEPGGSVIFLTPNAWNYNAWLIRVVPNAFHASFTRRLYGRPAADTFPTRYRLNSVSRIESLLRTVGFRRERLVLNGDPTYVGLNEPLFRLASSLERVFDIWPFRWARVHIIGAYRKVA
jgi:SAM-dependent methyltransferase